MSLRRILCSVAAIAVVSAGGVTLAAPALALPSFDTADVHVADPSAALTAITGVRVGAHPGYDRLVFDLSGPLPGYDVGYVGDIVGDGSGEPIPMAGSWFLAVSIHSVSGAPAQPTLYPYLRTLQEVRGSGFFEGHASYGLGLSDHTGYRAFTLTGPSRLVIDVQHNGPSRPSFSTEPISVPDRSAAQTAVTGVRVGHHVGFDRIVFDLTGTLPGYAVHSVDVVVGEGSGNPVPVQGSRFMSVVLNSVSSAVQPTVTPGFPALAQVVGTGLFEGYASYGIGLSYLQGFDAYTLTNPNRLVVDIATS